MQRIQPQTLTNDELERLIYITKPNELTAEWVAELLRRTNKDWSETKPKDPAQLELDLS
jgi:hypothetical protein